MEAQKMVLVFTDENGNKRTMEHTDYTTKTAFVKDVRNNGMKTSGAVFTEVEAKAALEVETWEKLSNTLKHVGQDFVKQCVVVHFMAPVMARSFDKKTGKYTIEGETMSYAMALAFLKANGASHKGAMEELKSLKERMAA